ncbi:hypothetical protein SAMN05428944_0047 [Streptomyces sp. 1222.5]|uniref:hypothetical protein n=1 Tax=unclassified Streptomyces TaxID=2593676 RepID=UPI000897077B|nr:MULTISPECIES: hypothetical protein [unclassified Streptomyces]PKW04985.1 hypothetical protein BX260_0044 [Streptomyces sp. 5112.2]SEB52844.1 hypothetical protein SAMN05428944_0047 [Streptomyces sp. 1222.5]
MFVNANARSEETDPTKFTAGPKGLNHQNQIQWRDARTGKLLAASDFYAPSTTGGTVPPGYGGLIYNFFYDGRGMALKVRGHQALWASPFSARNGGDCQPEDPLVGRYAGSSCRL